MLMPRTARKCLRSQYFRTLNHTGSNRCLMDQFFVTAGHSRPKDGVASARLCPGHPRLSCCEAVRRGCPGTSSAKTRFALLPGMTNFVTDSQDEANHSAADAGVLDDRAEQLPALAVELHHLHLLVDAVIGRRRMGGHAGQRQAAGEVLQTGRLLHDVFAREIVAALTQDMH